MKNRNVPPMGYVVVSI